MMAFKIHKMKKTKITIAEQTGMIKESMSIQNKDLTSKVKVHTIGSGNTEYSTTIKFTSNYAIPSGLDSTTYKSWGVEGMWNSQSIKCAIQSTCPHMTIQLLEHANLIVLNVLDHLGLDLQIEDVLKHDLTGAYGRNNHARVIIPREDRTDKECADILALVFDKVISAADELKLGRLTKLEYKPTTQYTTVYS